MADPQHFGARFGGVDPRTGKPYAFDAGYYFDAPLPTLPTGGKLNQVHVSREFVRYSDPKLDEFVTSIVTSITGNAAFATPPVTMTDLEAARVTFHNDVANRKFGGPPATLAKHEARLILISLLYTLAEYIEDLPDITEAIAATSGFTLVAKSAHQPRNPLTPTIKKVLNTVTTKLGVDVDAPGYWTMLEFRVSVNGGPPVGAGSFTSTQGIQLENLVPGTVYSIQCRAVAGRHHCSEWSDPVSHMAT